MKWTLKNAKRAVLKSLNRRIGLDYAVPVATGKAVAIRSRAEYITMPNPVPMIHLPPHVDFGDAFDRCKYFQLVLLARARRT